VTVQVLSEAEIKERLSASGRFGHERVQFDGQGLFYTQEEADCIDLEYPPKLERLPFFARLLATLGYDDADFLGALLWFTTWGVWNSMDEAPGYRIVEAMNRAAGQPRAFEVSPGHAFRADELADAVGVLMQPMVFGWDAYYLPQWSFGVEEFFLYVSHDSFVTVVTRTTAFHERVFRILEELELKPQRAHEQSRKRFCRAESEGN
jgi:hypothetical protein